ncbi:MAG: hypothetical protein RL745_369 [Actinomycetota bacterium]
MSAVVEPAGPDDAAPLHGAGESGTRDSAARHPDNSATASARWPGNDKPHRITMGMRPCEESDWLLRGPVASASIAQKQQVLADHHAQVFVMTDAGEAGAREAAEMVAHALGVDLATAQLLEGDAGAAAPAMHPLEVAARLVAEDLVVMSPADAGQESEYVLTAAVVCSPSRWDLREKVGRTMREIHQPVPDYDTIAAPTDRFFTRLHEGDIIERTNWTVLDNPTGFQPTPGPSWDVTIAELSDSQLLQHLWLRLERQTLRRLPASGSVLFTILTECARLDEVSRLGANVMRQLALWVGTTGQDVRTYRGWGAQAPRVAAALEAACSSSGH